MITPRLLFFCVLASMALALTGCSSDTPKGPSLTDQEKKAQVKKDAELIMQERKKV